MRIAILHPFQFRYARGIERFTWALSDELAKRGVLVDLLTWEWPRPVSWDVPRSGLTIRLVPNFRYYMRWLAVPYYLQWLAREKYDWVLIYFAGYGEGAALSLLTRIRPQRYGVVLQYPIEQVPQRYREFTRFSLASRADRMIAVSPHVARSAAAYFGRKCESIASGVDPKQFSVKPGQRQIVRQRFGLTESDRVIVSLAALEERKGMQWVVRALPRLLQEFPRLRYWILGEGAYRKTLETEIRELGLEQHVWLLGALSEVVPFLAAADIGCLLASGEAFGIATMEYMAMELPVVTSCHPPFDVLMQGSWGEMVNETNTTQVAETLGALLRDPLRRRWMGRAGRQHILDHYTWERVADQYLAILEEHESAPCASIHG